MRREEAHPDDKRLTLRLSQDLWRRVRVEAAKRDVSATLLINTVLDEVLPKPDGTHERG